MLYGAGLLLVVNLAMLVYCLLDVIRTPEDEVRNLPKISWVMLVIVQPLIAGIAWLKLGRPKAGATTRRSARDISRSFLPSYDQPGRTAASNPDDDEDFLRKLRERAEQQRREAERRKTEEQGRAQEPDEA